MNTLSEQMAEIKTGAIALRAETWRASGVEVIGAAILDFCIPGKPTNEAETRSDVPPFRTLEDRANEVEKGGRRNG